MSSRGHSASVIDTPGYQQSRPAIPISRSSVHSIPIQSPPTVYLGKQLYSPSSQQAQAYGHLQREHGSISSALTDSSPHTIPRQTAGTIHIYSPTLSLSSQPEEGPLETPRAMRAHPNQYTRPSRREMAEINAAYQQSCEEDDFSEISEAHAIRILVCCHNVISNSPILLETGLAVSA